MSSWATYQSVLMTMVAIAIVSLVLGSVAPQEKGVAHIGFGLALLALAVGIWMYVEFSS